VAIVAVFVWTIAAIILKLNSALYGVVMSIEEPQDGSIQYQEREAVAAFDNEAALHAAVESLMQFGLRQEDMSVLGDVGKLSIVPARELADAGSTPQTNYASPASRTEGLAALTGGPALVAGLIAAAVAGTGGAALIPAIAVTVGSTAVGGTLGFMLARVFGRKHAAYVERQIRNGGLLLWVHSPDAGNDARIADILKNNGAKDVHFHVANRSWSVVDRPLHDFNPDPLLR
jgi:hypothetical protein